MLVKTSDLKGRSLSWAVASLDNFDTGWLMRQLTNPNPETRAIPDYEKDATLAFELLNRERFEFSRMGQGMCAYYPGGKSWYGANHIESGLRCFVGSRMGEMFDLPEQLVVECASRPLFEADQESPRMQASMV